MSTYYFNNKWLTTLYCVLLSNLMPPHIPLYGSYFKSNISNFIVLYINASWKAIFEQLL